MRGLAFKWWKVSAGDMRPEAEMSRYIWSLVTMVGWGKVAEDSEWAALLQSCPVPGGSPFRRGRQELQVVEAGVGLGVFLPVGIQSIIPPAAQGQSRDRSAHLHRQL